MWTSVTAGAVPSKLIVFKATSTVSPEASHVVNSSGTPHVPNKSCKSHAPRRNKRRRFKIVDNKSDSISVTTLDNHLDYSEQRCDTAAQCAVSYRQSCKKIPKQETRVGSRLKDIKGFTHGAHDERRSAWNKPIKLLGAWFLNAHEKAAKL